MHVWITEISEPLPIDESPRLMRYGLLTKNLLSLGHRITWWHSTFHHSKKVYRYNQYTKLEINPHFHVHFLHGLSYKKNVSLFRIINHTMLAQQFTKIASECSAPDVILCAMPTLEITNAALEYAKGKNIPVITDIRDMWPDIFLEQIPSKLKPLARIFLLDKFYLIKKIIKESFSVIAVSQTYMQFGFKHYKRPVSDLDKVFYIAYEQSEIENTRFQQETMRLKNAGVDFNKTIACFFGTFGVTYDFSTVLSAAKILQEQNNQNFQFVFCGDGEKFQEVKNQSRNLKNVILLGWVGKETIITLSRYASIGLANYVLNAPQSVSNKPVEYLAFGLPILSSLEGEMQEFIENFKVGYQYMAANPESFLKALKNVRSNPMVHEQMKKNALNLYQQYFESSKVSRDFYCHIEKVVKIFNKIHAKKH